MLPLSSCNLSKKDDFSSKDILLSSFTGLSKDVGLADFDLSSKDAGLIDDLLKKDNL